VTPASAGTSDPPAASIRPAAATTPRPSPPLVIRAIVAAIVGALAGAGGLYAVHAWSPGFATLLDNTPTPAVARGLHPTEYEASGLSFAWTGDRVTLVFEGLDRSRPWTLVLRAKAGRGPGLPLPTATIAVDGTTRATVPIGPHWQDVHATLPTEARSRPTRIAIDVAPTFVPGPGDSRTLGMILDEVRLVPDGVPAPPRRLLTASAIAGAILAAMVVVVGVPLPWALGLLGAFAVAQAAVLTTGAGPYTRGYLMAVPRIAGGAGALAALIAATSMIVRRRPLSVPAGTAVAMASIALVLGVEGLLHPGKAIVDAVFHAHKLATVLAGHYFFTQPMPSGVEFPYAIGLYVTAAPWAGLTRDHVMLLRVVVATAHVLAALSLYPLVRRHWQQPWAAVTAVAAYLMAPLPFVVIGNANQTYAFGQSIATIAVASAMTWRLDWRRPLTLAGLVGLLALGLLSHVGLIALLGGLIGAAALLVAWRGTGDDRSAGWIILAATLVAALLAVGVYYRHFGEAFRSAQRVGAGGAASGSAPGATSEASPDRPPSEGAAAAAANRPGAAAGTSRLQRAGRAARLAVAAYGAPLLLLALVGVLRLPLASARDRATLLVLASLAVCAVVGAVSVLAPVEPRFERYTDEFISRLYYAVTPAIALLAAGGVSSLWMRGSVGRGAAVAGLLGAVIVAGRMWLGWVG
jgi:hypothetical protein